MANKPNESRMAAKKHKQHKQGGNGGGSLFWRICRWILGIIGVAIVAGVLLFAWYAKDAPQINEATLRSDGSSVLYDQNNNKITTLGTENRDYTPAQKIPQRLKDAVVAIEDRRFYNEPFGIDPLRIVSAAVSNLTHRGGLQGGSTLTQQLVKLSVFSTKTSDQTLKRKAQEAWLAMKVEQRFSKEQILEFYINKVYMNYGQYGMGTAANYYYGKSLNQLSIAQTAFIAGLAQAPVGYDPFEHPTAATTRRNEVINAMLRAKKISSTQASAATATPISSGLVKHSSVAKNQSDTDKIVDSYVTEVISEVKKQTGLNPYTAGLRIYTNLDMSAQRRLYSIVNSNEYLAFPDNKLQTAVTMTNPNNGRVLAQIGGRKTGDVKLAYNRAVANTRSNGSTMKPMLDYGPAIEYDNDSTYTQIDDSPYKYPGTDTSVYDWDNQYQGVISMRQALVGSRNIPAIKTLDSVGISKGMDFLKGLGITLPQSQQTAISSAIGGSVSTLQEAAAYGAFANGGTYYKPQYVRKIRTQDGVTTSYSSSGSRAMKSSTAYMLTDMMKGVLTDNGGTGLHAQVPGLYEAGKTGSVNYSDEEIANNPALRGLDKDSWFTGYTRNRVISVWAGYDKSQEAGLGGTAQTIPQLIYKNLMSYVADGLPNRDWTKPSTVVARNILIGSNPPEALSEAVSGKTTRELFVRGASGHVITSNNDAAVSSSSSVLYSDSSSSSSADESTSSSSSSAAASSSSSSAPAAAASSSAAQSSSSAQSSVREPAASSSSAANQQQ
ncbi:PBP1A family penicillin-binding protein [Lacticaseibacillus zhaodongensis]|uniref:PBP1A family penicillin-binding protein n=1 Tax=Lacticaseibacillus zhaodongensis TaxID=2668065 RepID=UPI0012D2AB24|nr:PBP1A family penicillin-binding protein [Lacticaseibacillus zhaodongensis]